MPLSQPRVYMNELEFIYPDWPAPSHVRAAMTTRTAGVSAPPFDSLNLGARTDDTPDNVAENRHRISAALSLPEPPRWLAQVHGIEVVPADAVDPDATAADACWSDQAGQVCAVLTADCLPVLFCDHAGERIAAAHAGWRGLAAGVLEATVDALGCPAEQLLAWLGPAIGPSAFEVGDEVRDAFVAANPEVAQAFRPSPQGRWLADLHALARARLAAHGLRRIFGGVFCTYNDSQRFFSHRRDGRTGRMASLIWR